MLVIIGKSNCSPQLRCGIANDVSDRYALELSMVFQKKLPQARRKFVENWLIQFLSTKSAVQL
jgi:hypothetical protein